MGVLDIMFNIFDPFCLYRKHVIRPVGTFAHSLFDHYTAKARNNALTVRDIVLRFGIISIATAIVIWSAVFMYVAFYYAYMPAIAHTRPVHMQFQACPEKSGPCSFPHAHVSLTKKQQLLMVGQAYKVLVNIDMPESPNNQILGMFMVCADMRDHDSSLRGHSCRAAMLRYKSPLVRTLTTWILSPLFVFGLKEEHQEIPVELFTSYEEDQTHPVTDVYVEILSQQIEFYSVSLHITADFTGLRYLMFHWPILSATVGISTNLFFILTVFVLSWYHWSDTTWIHDAREKYRQLRSPKSDMSTTIDDSNNLLDDDDLSILEEKSSSKSDIEELSGASGFGGEEEARLPVHLRTEFSFKR